MKRVSYILFLMFTIIFYYLSRGSDLLLLTISFSMFGIFMSIFSSTNIKSFIDKRSKLFWYSVLSIIGIFVILGGISYFVGVLTNIRYLSIVNVVMTLFTLCSVLIRVIGEYLSVLGYKRIGNNIYYVYNIINVISLSIFSILLYKVFSFSDYINIIVLYLVGIINFFLIIIILYFLIFRKIKKYKKVKEEKINYSDIKKILVNDSMVTIFNVVKTVYFYSTIIILYFVLINKYNYSYDTVTEIITDIFLFGLVIIYFLYTIIRKVYYEDDVIDKDNFNSYINNVIRLVIPLSIVLIVISGPISNIIFNSDYNIMFCLVLLIPFYSLYEVIINTSITCINNKKVVVILLISLFLKLVFEIPFIDAIYRMGNDLILGSIFAIILGFIVSVFVSTIFIVKKFKLQLLDNFSDILNIIYENIILCLILVLFTFIVKIDIDGFIPSLFTIVFYLFITVLFYVLKYFIKRK